MIVTNHYWFCGAIRLVASVSEYVTFCISSLPSTNFPSLHSLLFLCGHNPIEITTLLRVIEITSLIRTTTRQTAFVSRLCLSNQLFAHDHEGSLW
jgi:hypothetical protein